MEGNNKQGMDRYFESSVDFLGEALSKRKPPQKIGKFNTCDGKADSEPYNN